MGSLVDGVTIVIAKDEDISKGVEKAIPSFTGWTLYLKTKGAIDIVIQLSPDNGKTWFEIFESPVSFATAGDKVIKLNYDATHVKLIGSNTTQVTAIIRGLID